jgi:hypothetical protein
VQLARLEKKIWVLHVRTNPFLWVTLRNWICSERNEKNPYIIFSNKMATLGSPDSAITVMEIAYQGTS